MAKMDKKWSTVKLSDVIREYIHVAKPYWFTLILVTIGSVIPTVASSIIVPVYYKNFFDILSVKAETSVLVNELVHTIFLILIMNFIGWCGFRLQNFSMVHFQTKIMSHLRQNAFITLR
jgi:ABC-type multidrug transport system fused ATPase/permease subunit